tara:strand:+ start:186 stop:677 length:492 start_codon:yes stop_codon:yes gene_type:complete
MDYFESNSQHDELEDCIEEKMRRGEDIEDCLEYGGGEIGVWPNGGEDRCFRYLVIKADVLVGRHMLPVVHGEPKFGPCDKALEDFLDYQFRKCPDLERITIQGSEFAMRKLKIVTDDCNKKDYFRGKINGLNNMRRRPIVVSCFSKRGNNDTSHVKKVYYLPP